MCKKTQFKYCPSTIDKCMKIFIKNLNDSGIETLSCCCGHGKYAMSILVRVNGIIYDVMSNTPIPRKKRFYKRDKQGYYYIPEVIEKPKT